MVDWYASRLSVHDTDTQWDYEEEDDGTDSLDWDGWTPAELDYP